MEIGYWTLIGIGCGIAIACFVRILMKIAQNKNSEAGIVYKQLAAKRKYKSEPTLA